MKIGDVVCWVPFCPPSHPMSGKHFIGVVEQMRNGVPTFVRGPDGEAWDPSVGPEMLFVASDSHAAAWRAYYE